MAAIATTRTYRRRRRQWPVTQFLVSVVFTLALISDVCTGLDDLYSNSYISPNSARDAHYYEDDHADQDRSQAPEMQPTVTQFDGDHQRVIRSADPILVRSFDDLNNHFKNLAESIDDNKLIQPSRTMKEHIEAAQSAMGGGLPDRLSGEGSGAPQARQLLEPLHIDPTATTAPTRAASATSADGILSLPPGSDRPRQSNPDIQDIITGIVKLLNGNVNVQANTSPSNGGRPLRPLSTRINNRGPPRITDVPALPPDFDVPSQPLPPLPPPPPVVNPKPPAPVATNIPMRVPTPYPFDVPPPPPHQNTSPVRPMMGGGMQSTKRPLYRPVTIPPWSRPPYRRPFPQRRPTPIPPYQHKPEETISLTSERPGANGQGEDILTLDLGSEMISSFEEHREKNKNKDKDVESGTTPMQDVYTTLDNQADDEVPKEDNKDDKDKDFEKHKEKSTSKMEKHSLTHSQASQTDLVQSDQHTQAAILNDVYSTEVTEIATSSLLPSSSPIDIVYNDSLELNTTATTWVESSIQELSVKDVSSIEATESLPTAALASTASAVTSDVVPNATATPTNAHNATSSSGSAANHSAAGQSFPYYPYRPRPGIVLDDTEYKPGGMHRPPILTARPPVGQIGEIFDVTVSAIQGPGGSSGSGQGKPYVIPVDIENIHGSGRPGQVHLHAQGDVITSPVGNEGFVSIDGKRTYLNLFGEQTVPPSGVALTPTPTQSVVKATGYAEVEKTKVEQHAQSGGPNGLKPTPPRRPLYGKRPTPPPVRIDTCIVGDDSTCDASQYEICMTEAGVSSCHCRPGHARRKHREPCRRVVSMLISLRVDRLYDRRVVWTNELANRAADPYQQLAYEAERALDSAMSMTPFSDEFLGARVNGVYEGDRSQGQAGVFVNLTLQLEENAETARQNVRADIQRHLLGVIQRRSNNIGNSALWVDSPPGSVSNLQDVDECSAADLNDCHLLARCVNTFGGFKCVCNDGYRDPWSDNKHRAGRHCEQCSSQHCNNRGECKYENGQEVCVCSGNYYGTQCELDGEVLGVAIGASVAAIIIIGLTLVCLVMWSRRWNREQKAAMGSPVFGYMATASNSVKTPVVGGPPYQLTLEDRLRWAQIADAMAQTNHYAPEPVTSTRPSSAMFGYPSLSMAGTLPHGNLHGTLPPIPLPRLSIPTTLACRAASVHGMRPLDNSSSSEEEDKVDLLGRSFQVPRPKSRSNASIANQSGIYYDVDYDQNEIYKHPAGGNIPMSTYTAGRHPFYRS